MQHLLNDFVTLHPLLFVSLLLWSLAWKGLALWRAGRRNEPVWFLALLLVNTLGILEIIYLFLTTKQKTENTG